MPSKTEIANFALDKIGQPNVQNIESNAGAAERACNRHFAQVVREVGTAAPFSCLTKFASLTESGTAPYKWEKSFALPANFLRVNTFNELDVYEQFSDYFQTDAKFLYCDADTAQIEYNEFTENTGLYEPLMVDAVAALLAVRVAPTILGSTRDVKDLMAAYDMAIGKALTATNRRNRQHNTINEVIQGSRLLKSRRISTNG